VEERKDGALNGEILRRCKRRSGSGWIRERGKGKKDKRGKEAFFPLPPFPFPIRKH
jgi:hypothetical protein